MPKVKSTRKKKFDPYQKKITSFLRDTSVIDNDPIESFASQEPAPSQQNHRPKKSPKRKTHAQADSEMPGSENRDPIHSPVRPKKSPLRPPLAVVSSDAQADSKPKKPLPFNARLINEEAARNQNSLQSTNSACMSRRLSTSSTSSNSSSSAPSPMSDVSPLPPSLFFSSPLPRQANGSSLSSASPSHSPPRAENILQVGNESFEILPTKCLIPPSFVPLTLKQVRRIKDGKTFMLEIIKKENSLAQEIYQKKSRMSDFLSLEKFAWEDANGYHLITEAPKGTLLSTPTVDTIQASPLMTRIKILLGLIAQLQKIHGMQPLPRLREPKLCYVLRNICPENIVIGLKSGTGRFMNINYLITAAEADSVRLNKGKFQNKIQMEFYTAQETQIFKDPRNKVLGKKDAVLTFDMESDIFTFGWSIGELFSDVCRLDIHKDSSPYILLKGEPHSKILREKLVVLLNAMCWHTSMARLEHYKEAITDLKREYQKFVAPQQSHQTIVARQNDSPVAAPAQRALAMR